MSLYPRRVRGRDLVLAYDFDDPQEFDSTGKSRPRLTAADVSGNGQDIQLVTLPRPSDIVIERKQPLHMGALAFKNNYALAADAIGMPTGDVTGQLHAAPLLVGLVRKCVAVSRADWWAASHMMVQLQWRCGRALQK